MTGTKKKVQISEENGLVEREVEGLVMERKWNMVEGKKGKKIGKQGCHLQGGGGGREFNHQKY